jgi:hypothetical protein
MKSDNPFDMAVFVPKNETWKALQTITLPEGYNADEIEFSLCPVDRQGNLVKLQENCTGIGRKPRHRWVHIDVYNKLVLSDKFSGRKTPDYHPDDVIMPSCKETKRVGKSPYEVCLRVDWIRKNLESGIKFNSSDHCAKFGRGTRTALRDMSFVKKEYYGKKLSYSIHDKSFFLVHV